MVQVGLVAVEEVVLAALPLAAAKFVFDDLGGVKSVIVVVAGEERVVGLGLSYAAAVLLIQYQSRPLLHIHLPEVRLLPAHFAFEYVNVWVQLWLMLQDA